MLSIQEGEREIESKMRDREECRDKKRVKHREGLEGESFIGKGSYL